MPFIISMLVEFSNSEDFKSEKMLSEKKDYESLCFCIVCDDGPENSFWRDLVGVH